MKTHRREENGTCYDTVQTDCNDVFIDVDRLDLVQDEEGH